jgi:hypothetical protein
MFSISFDVDGLLQIIGCTDASDLHTPWPIMHEGIFPLLQSKQLAGYVSFDLVTSMYNCNWMKAVYLIHVPQKMTNATQLVCFPKSNIEHNCTQVKLFHLQMPVWFHFIDNNFFVN